MAYALESLADLNEAVEHYTAAKKLDPKCTTTLYNVANAYHDLGQVYICSHNLILACACVFLYRFVLKLLFSTISALPCFTAG
jgi:tetratricopeptide (TPR) repeat protein